jgi:hypothetical protein
MATERSYCGPQDVELRIGDLVTGRVFSQDTVPELAQVESIIAAVAAEMNSTLAGSGYAAPVDAAADPDARLWATAANAAGAAARILAALPASGPGKTGESDSRLAAMLDEYRQFIDAARQSRLATSRVSSGLARLKAGSYEHADGTRTVPVFTRDMWDYPGSGERRHE